MSTSTGSSSSAASALFAKFLGCKKARLSMSTSSDENKEEPPQDPREHVSQTREKISNQLSQDETATNYDIHQNILEIRAILKTNDEIFSRVIGYADTNNRKRGKSTSFEIVGCRTVNTLLVDGKTQFLTNPERHVKEFDTSSLSSLPDNLNPSNILQIPYDYSHSLDFIDFRALLESSLVLHDDILGPFLASLKGHLMSVQVCLGNIEEWILGFISGAAFLESTFDKKIEMKDKYCFPKQKCKCPEGIHSATDDCLRCNNPFSSHLKYKDPIRRFCPDTSGKGFTAGYFTCSKQITVLKEFRVAGGRFEAAFDLSKEDDRIMLEQFLNFVGGVGEAI